MIEQLNEELKTNKKVKYFLLVNRLCFLFLLYLRIQLQKHMYIKKPLRVEAQRKFLNHKMIDYDKHKFTGLHTNKQP